MAIETKTEAKIVIMQQFGSKLHGLTGQKGTQQLKWPLPSLRLTMTNWLDDQADSINGLM